MSNKTDLQENNVKLQTIKNNIEELPESNAWTGQTSIVPGTQSITIPAYTDTALTVQGDVNLIAENIASGVSIFGVTGTAPTSLTAFGIDFGQFTVSNKHQVTVNHSLGVKPKMVMMYPISIPDLEMQLIFHINPYFNHRDQERNYYGFVIRNYDYDADYSESGNYATSTATTITFDEKSTIRPISGTYGWVAIA